VFLGRDDPHRVLGWASPDIYGPHDLKSYYAVKVYGSGHVIAHNAVAFFHDGISVATHGTPDGLKAVAIDIYNNDIHLTGDDFIETDGGVHNIRVMRNRGFNAAHTGLSAQPVFGGPAYFIRQRGLQRAHRAEVHGQAGRTDPVSQHRDFGEPEYADVFQRAFPQQPVPGDGRAGSLRRQAFPNATAYSDLRLRRIPPEPRAADQYVWIAPGRREAARL
jgi:hypothetical protein